MSSVRRLAALAERHQTRSTVLVGLLCTLGLLLRMFVPGPVGLSDQGDGHRLLCELGLRNDVPWGATQSDYVRFTWVPHRYYGETCGANQTSQPYYSSALVLMRMASWLTPILHLPGALDLRALAVLCCIIAGVAIGWLVHEIRGAMLARAAVGVLVGLIVADGGIAQYFASPYSETAVFLGLLLLIPAALRLMRNRHTGLSITLAVFAIGAFVLTAKTQAITFLPAIVPVLVFRPGSRGAPADERSETAGRTRGRVRHRVAGMLAAVALIGITVGYLNAQPPRFQELDAYSQVFQTILPSSPDRAGDLRFFGLDPALAIGSGSNILSPNSVAADPAYVGFTDKVTTTRVVEFYVTHPGRIFGLAAQGLRYAGTYRVSGYLADYPQSSGAPPFALDHRVEVLTYVYSFFGAAPFLFALVWLAGLIGFGIATRRGSAAGLLGLGLTVGIIAQFWAVLLSEGYGEAIKHMIIVDYATALLLPVAIIAWMGRRLPLDDPPTPANADPHIDEGAAEYGRHSMANVFGSTPQHVVVSDPPYVINYF